MTFIKLKSPVPKEDCGNFLSQEYSFSGVLIEGEIDPNLPAHQAIFRDRHCVRKFGELSNERLFRLLYLTSHTICVKEIDGHPIWQHRPVPSAGGIHPIDILVCKPYDASFGLYWYDSLNHQLKQVNPISPDAFKALVVSIKEVLDPQFGTALLYAADFAKTSSRYINGESLVWRDSGVLVGFTCIASVALGLSCCPLGPTFDSEIAAVLGSKAMSGVGGCVVGA